MDKIGYSALLDYYGSLLTDYQKEILRQYYDCDMSLKEISDGLGVTRQAISDVIKRATEKLKETDEKLQVMQHSKRLTTMLAMFRDEFLNEADETAQQAFQKIQNLAREI